MPFKSFIPAFVFSLTLHAAAGYSFYSASAHRGAEGALPLKVSYPASHSFLSEKSIEITMVAPPKKQEPRKTVLSGDVKVHQKTRAIRQARLRVQTTAKKTAADPPGSVVRESSDLLADPQVGRVFSDYFLKIKEQIHQAAKNNYSSGASERGKATLVFILRSDGSLDRVSVADDRSSADNQARDFAVDCVKKAAPFPSFPKELNLSKISFSISVVFEDL